MYGLYLNISVVLIQYRAAAHTKALTLGGAGGFQYSVLDQLLLDQAYDQGYKALGKSD